MNILSRLHVLGTSLMEGKCKFTNEVQILGKIKFGDRNGIETIDSNISYNKSLQSISFITNSTKIMDLKPDSLVSYKKIIPTGGIFISEGLSWGPGSSPQSFGSLNAGGSDIIGLKGLFWKTSCQGSKEGILMPKTSGDTYSTDLSRYNVFKMLNDHMYFDDWKMANSITKSVICKELALMTTTDPSNMIIKATLLPSGSERYMDFYMGDDANTKDGYRYRFNSSVYGEYSLMDLTPGNSGPKSILTVYGDIHADRVHNALWNDYAEYFEKSETEVIEPGDIICISNDSDNYTKTTSAYQNTVVGVCSDSYGHILGGTNDEESNKNNFTPIGLSGRVDVKVIGRVRKGDLIVSSDIPGVGMKADLNIPGTVVGKAVQNKDTDDIEKVKILIMNI